MEPEFDDTDLARMEQELDFTGGFAKEVVRGFRKVMGAVRAATDTRDLYNGGLQTEKLKGDRNHEHSIRINKQWRLIVEIQNPKIRIKKIEDYH